MHKYKITDNKAREVWHMKEFLTDGRYLCFKRRRTTHNSLPGLESEHNIYNMLLVYFN